jgi:hypothetical protein
VRKYVDAGDKVSVERCAAQKVRACKIYASSGQGQYLTVIKQIARSISITNVSLPPIASAAREQKTIRRTLQFQEAKELGPSTSILMLGLLDCIIPEGSARGQKKISARAMILFLAPNKIPLSTKIQSAGSSYIV